MQILKTWMFLCAVLLALTSAGADLSGTYDVGTLTPLERPEAFGESRYMTAEQAAQIEARMGRMMAADSAPSDPDRAAPPKGRLTNGYNFFWVDPGSSANQVGGKFRTSIITSPANGRIPPMTTAGAARLSGMLARWEIIWRNPDPTTEKDGGSAWWLDGESGPYDHLEQRPLAERCILGSRSTAGPPMLPNFYNNHKRIVQTDDHVMILTEMNHDARIIRIGGERRPQGVQTWLGDSVGRWEGDALIVETTNFTTTPALSGADENLQVRERFEKQEDGNLLYAFEVINPTVWTSNWGGEYTWRMTREKVYEYACHEGNYALGNVMRGARMLEAQAAGR